jgi:hypothetical protein
MEQRKREMEEITARPTISPKSRELAQQSERFSKPIYSEVRYKQEIDKYNAKKEEAVRIKYL